VEQLKKIWEPGSNVDRWKEVDPSFADEKLTLFGAGTDSGTFDYFTDAIVGEEGASRSDYTPSEDDNVTVSGVAGEQGALGYFGLSYYLENRERLKALAIDGGDGCVEPSVETVQDGSYKPLSRPLYVYVNEDKLADEDAIDPFLTFVLDNEPRLARGAKFVPMTQQQIDRAKTALDSGGVGIR
jgi:phosphate transport system substrate-binding protein